MGTNFGGWYVLLGNYTMKIQVNVPTPKFVPTFLTFTKRNFLYNAPLYKLLEELYCELQKGQNIAQNIAQLILCR